MDQRPDFPAGPDIDELIECLAGDSQCPLCGAPFSHEGLQAVRTDASRWILSVHCHCCGTGSLITAAVPRSFLTLAPQATEISSDEWLGFDHSGPLSADDVLDMHVFLSHFHGDLSSLVSDSRAAGAA